MCTIFCQNVTNQLSDKFIYAVFFSAPNFKCMYELMRQKPNNLIINAKMMQTFYV